MILADPELDRRLRDDGYAVVDFATPEQIEELLAIYHRSDSGRSSGYYPSIMSNDAGYKAEVHRDITDLFWPTFERFLVGYRPLVGAFMVKHPGLDTAVPPHQDWNVIDERIHRSLNCWIPTSRIDATVGQMAVLPASHRYLRGLRGSPSFPTQWMGIHQRIYEELMVDVHVDVGQAIIYDNRVLHGTPPNQSQDTRVVAYINAIPEDAQPIHYYRDTDGTVTGFEVEPEFFHTFTLGDHPVGRAFVTIPNYWIDPLNFDELQALHHAAGVGSDATT